MRKPFKKKSRRQQNVKMFEGIFRKLKVKIYAV